MKRPRKRTLLPRMVLLLLAYSGGGAIVNVAVAWGLAFKPVDGKFFFSNKRIDVAADDSNLLWMNSLGWFKDPTQRWIWQYVFATGWDHQTLWLRKDVGTDWYAIRVFTGLPFRSMQGAVLKQHDWMHEQFSDQPWIAVDSTILGDDSLAFPAQTRLLPLRPLWPGFAINTIFYAAILWLLFAAPRIPGFVRRRIRARRGQCPACAYPIGTSDVCTECGRPVRVVH